MQGNTIRIHPTVEHISDDHYRPLPEAFMQTNNNNQADHDSERIINFKTLLLQRISTHQADFKRRIASSKPIRLRPGDGGEPARNFKPVNPLDEWYNVSDEPGLAVMILKTEQAIDLIEIEGKWYARPAA